MIFKAKKLQSLIIEFHNCTAIEKLSLTELLKALKTLRELKYLKIVLDKTYFDGFNLNQIFNRLPNLSIVDIEFKHQSWKEEHNKTLQVISTRKNITSLSLNTAFYYFSQEKTLDSSGDFDNLDHIKHLRLTF